MRVLASLIALCSITLPAAAQGPLAGDWEGWWARAGDTMAVTMHVRHDAQTGRYAATFDSDRLRVGGIPFADVQLQGCCDVTLTLRGDRTTTVFTGALRGDSLTGVLREGESSGSFGYARAAAAGPAFEEREITFPSGDATLAGSLILPATGTGFPAVVFLHGSGAEGRWASRYLATRLASRGVAALIFDKRGVGGSSGDWHQATPDDLAADGAAAVARLLQEPAIDRRRIGIHGHSQGGALAPLVAARSEGGAALSLPVSGNSARRPKDLASSTMRLVPSPELAPARPRQGPSVARRSQYRRQVLRERSLRKSRFFCGFGIRPFSASSA
jgi:hypothetical protein